MLLGVMAPQERPLGVTSVRLTGPANPLRGVMLIVELADEPTLTVGGEELLIVKSWNRKIDIAEWVNEPLVPVRVSV